MKYLKHIFLGAFTAIALSMSAQDCELFIQVVPAEDSDAPAQIESQLDSRLKRALTAKGVVADSDYGQLYLQGSFSDVYKQELAGPPAQVAVHTTLTLSLADFGGMVFATEAFDLRGVGTSEQRAYINALQSISPKSKQFESFIASAKKKTISYFDKNYTSILSKADRAASMRDYEQALYYSTLIPSCSQGYAAAEQATDKYYQQYIDYNGAMLLKQARAAFAVSPNAEGAAEAYAFLSQIDPASASEAAALKFADEVKKQTKVEYDFEVHQKYNDQVDLTKRRIDAARQVGVAYGKGQPSRTTNILWK